MIIQKAQDVHEIIKTYGLDVVLAETTNRLHRAFTHLNEYDIRPRVGYHNEFGVFDVMPVLNEQYFSLKYINCHPQNTLHNMPTILGVMMLVDARTGEPILIADAAVLTAIRTAAMQALAYRLTKLNEPRILGVIGSGAQAEFLIIALQQERSFDEILIYDIDQSAADHCCRNLEDIIAVKAVDKHSLLDSAEVLVTATAALGHHTLFETLPSQVQMILAVGGDTCGKTELSVNVLSQCQIFVELLSQAKNEGEIQQVPNHPNIREIGSVIKNGIDSRDGCVLFDSVGISLEDLVIMEWYYHQVKSQQQEFCAWPQNPKDLYSLVRS